MNKAALHSYFRALQRKSAAARWDKLTLAQRSARMRKLSKLAAQRRKLSDSRRG